MAKAPTLTCIWYFFSCYNLCPLPLVLLLWTSKKHLAPPSLYQAAAGSHKICLLSSPGWASAAPSVSQLHYSTKPVASLRFAPVCPGCCTGNPKLDMWPQKCQAEGSTPLGHLAAHSLTHPRMWLSFLAASQAAVHLVLLNFMRLLPAHLSSLSRSPGALWHMGCSPHCWCHLQTCWECTSSHHRAGNAKIKQHWALFWSPGAAAPHWSFLEAWGLIEPSRW